MDGCTDENRDDRGSNSFMYFVCSFFRSFFFSVDHFSGFTNSKSYTVIIVDRVTQIFDKSRSHHKIPGPRRVTKH